MAQTTIVRGKIKDAINNETLPYVNVHIIGGALGTSVASDRDGKYEIKIQGDYNKLRFTSMGYIDQDVSIELGKEQTIDISMEADEYLLEEVVIVGKKRRYSNRDNPAVALIKKVIEHKSQNRLTGQDYVQYEEYERVSFALSNLSEKFKNRRIFRDYQFLFTEQDTTDTLGQYVLPAYMQEKLSQVYFRKEPKKKKQYVLAEKQAKFDANFISNDGIRQYVNRMYEDIDIYENNVPLLSNMFLSPIANTAPTFYKFYITDTIKSAEPWLVELSFLPRNTTDQLFTGRLYVTLDGNYAVQNAYLTVDDRINLNFVRDLEATLTFEKDANNRFYLDRSDLQIDFALSDKGSGIRGRRIVNYKDYQVDIAQPDSIYSGSSEELVLIADEATPDADWAALRHIPLELNEANIYRNVDTLQTIGSFRRFMNLSTLLIAGYQVLGPVEVGPVNTFYSFNPIEGFRLRMGGRTTPDFSQRFYAETYAAYGFGDERWKYFLSGTYSINNKSIYSFPQHYLRASFQRDTKIPGESLQFVQEDNFLLSFKRGDNYRWLYNDIYRLEYLHELQNNFSYGIELSKWMQSPAGILTYQQLTPSGNIIDHQQLNTTEVSLRLRYAPNEQFYQGKLYRTPIFNRYPIFNLNYTAGIRGFLDGQYNYHNISANVFKRVYLSQFGYADVNVEGAYIIGDNIPYPLLTVHRANQTYAYQLNAYNLMNFLEFVTDRHAAVNIQYYMNGFIFNKIPLFNRLKWREVFSFKGIWGDLRDINNPAYNSSVFRFQEKDGVPITYTFSHGPYMEASVGIANIFKLFRVDVVKRLSYLDNPEVPEWGLRMRFKLDF